MAKAIWNGAVLAESRALRDQGLLMKFAIDRMYIV